MPSLLDALLDPIRMAQQQAAQQVQSYNDTAQGYYAGELDPAVQADLQGQGFRFDPATGRWLPPAGYGGSEADFLAGVQRARERQTPQITQTAADFGAPGGSNDVTPPSTSGQHATMTQPAPAAFTSPPGFIGNGPFTGNAATQQGFGPVEGAMLGLPLPPRPEPAVQGNDYIDAPTGSLRAQLEQQRQGQSQYGTIKSTLDNAVKRYIGEPGVNLFGDIGAGLQSALPTSFRAPGPSGFAEPADTTTGRDIGRFIGNLVVPQSALQLGVEFLPGVGDIRGLAAAIRSGGAEALAREAPELLPDIANVARRGVLEVPQNAPEALQLGETAGRTVVPRTASAASASASPLGVRLAGAAEETVTQPATKQLLGLQVPSAGLSRADRTLNSVKRLLGTGIESDAVATPIMRERARALQVADNQANRLGAVVRRGAKVFKTDKAGRILTLPGSPTIADLAARLPDYEAFLTPAQKSFVASLESGLKPYTDALLEQGIDVRTRGDIMDGGFYVPRGRAEQEGLDLPNKYTGGGARGGKRGFEKTAKFDSQTQGIEAGFEYAKLGDAVQSYAKDAGGRITDAFTANSLLNLTDDAGNLLAETAADRLNPQLRDQVQGLRAKIGGRLQTISRQTARTEAQRSDERRVMNLLRRTEANIDRTAYKLDAMSPTELAFKKAEAELRILDRMANRVGGTAQDIGEAAFKGENSRAARVEAVKELRGQLDGLRGEWERAKRVANETPRGQGRTNLPGLQAYSFPDAMAEAINKELRVGQQSGPVEEVIKAVNNLLRPIRATADVSFMGIQGLLGAVDKPLAYGRALKTAVRSLADGEASGAFVKAFDDKALRDALPTSEDWLREGLRFGGTDTEFTIGQGVGIKRAGNLIQKTPVIKQANRAFGTFGDTLRLSMAQDEYGLRKLAGEPVSQMREIATAVNRATGVGKGRFLGDFGDLAEFAPRYFMSQLELIGKVVQPGNDIGNKMARRQLLKLIGAGSLLTVGVNEALNNKYDYTSPFINGRFNSNFMRIRINGQDVSVFAGWDSLLRATASAAKGDFGYLARTKASPLVSSMWDLLTGENFIGQPTIDLAHGKIDTQRGITFASSFLPFSGQALANDQSLTGALLNVSGVKSTPETRNEKRDDIARSMFNLDYREATATQRQQIDAEADKRLGARTPGELSTARAEGGAEERQQQALLGEQAFLAGQFPSGGADEDLPDLWSNLAKEAYGASSQLNRDFNDMLGGFKPSRSDKIVDGYYDLQQQNAIGRPDFDATNKARADYIASLSRTPGPNGTPSDYQYMTDYLAYQRSQATPVHQAYYDYIDMMDELGYFDLDDDSKKQVQREYPQIEAEGAWFHGGVEGGPPASMSTPQAVEVFQAMNAQYGTNFPVKLEGTDLVINANEGTMAAYQAGGQVVGAYLEADPDTKKEMRKDPEVIAWLVAFGYNVKIGNAQTEARFNAINQQYGLGVTPSFFSDYKK